MQDLKEKTKYGRKLGERKPTNYPFFLRDDKKTYPDTYKEDFNYCIILVDPRQQKPIDCRIVKTTKTLENFIKDKHGRHKLDILFHPNPVKLTADFWEKYRKTENGAERLKLFADQKVLVDSSMLFIDTITIDIDSPFEEAIQVLNDLTKDLEIPAEVLEVRKTKSGNLRFSFAIYPIKPGTLNKNGKTNLQNVKEFVSIINEYFKLRGLKADDSFKRINHPVWITKPEELVLEATEEIDFYTLYRKAKELQKKLKLYQLKEKPKSNKLVNLPAFIANKFRHIETQSALEKAVETLARTHKKGTYIHFLQVVAGWSKYLGLSYAEYYELVSRYTSKVRDIETAWRYANPLEFNNERVTKNTKYDLVKYAEKVIDYLKENGATPRQQLLKEVFDNQSWLEQIIMLELKQQGLITETFEKNPAGVGRPIKVYSLDKSIFKDGISENIENKGFEKTISCNPCHLKFRQIYTSLFRESILEVVGNRFNWFSFFNFYVNLGGFNGSFVRNVENVGFELFYNYFSWISLDVFDDLEGWLEMEKKGQKQHDRSGRIDNYLMSLDRQLVEVHIAYGNTVLQMQGTLKAKARYDFILEFPDDSGRLQRVIINKAYLIMVKPLPH
jgi:hypothetical protein